MTNSKDKDLEAKINSFEARMDTKIKELRSEVDKLVSDRNQIKELRQNVNDSTDYEE